MNTAATTTEGKPGSRTKHWGRAAANEMEEMSRAKYLSYRREFEPTNVKLAIVAESPPASGKYFYNPTGSGTEPLFAALMKQLAFTPLTKEIGLREFQRQGWVLVDATYRPVNALGKLARDKAILEDYTALRNDLAALSPASVILIKENVCRLLEHKLVEDCFKVVKNGAVIYFPSTGRQTEFDQQFSSAMKLAGFDL
jgi:hypothetical protein